eukprot:CAMPEP_0181188002 /NCGR_PEP_ID=MMETSP1096-20121128/10876_1 /TAXON_ID=156174 ORGANISM="Chrysochromulina ericina, Strain CCMP281" /NCGR_SAMPLE_ID=MMETSP1096 /ASSEMBLY_ACC=CAM_ASM_000453 /LENGTH=273 /DNA_ID=CAMNT_0023277019 /DNA_START=305 /DNA_END=1126 /DNA_ORIENTATION=-
MWGVRRQNYAALCGNARNLNIQISSFLPIDLSNSELMTTRKRLARWVMLAYELAFMKARGRMDSNDAREHLEGNGLLQPGEWDVLAPGDRHSTVFWWIQTEMVRLSRAGVIEIHYVTTTAEAISSMRAQANDLMSSLDRDKPYSYAALCALLVKVNILIFSTWKAVEWAVWLHNFGGKLVEQPKFWLDILILFAWNVSYQGMYDLAYLLHNPFGDRRLDVAHETIGGGIRKLSEKIAGVDGYLPPSLLAPVLPPPVKIRNGSEANEKDFKQMV